MGLTDPVVVNHFLLWTLWSGASVLLLIVRVAASTVFGGDEPGAVTPQWLTLAELGGALTCAIAIWLAFFPPRFCKRWVWGRWRLTGGGLQEARRRLSAPAREPAAISAPSAPEAGRA